MSKAVKKKAPVKKESTTDLQILGERIKALRIAKGYTSYETFAYENNFNRSQFGRYENGEDLRYSSLLRVIRALGITPAEFFNEVFE
jgi:transcriptional regulator with XRE-family HTH domain